VLELVAERVTFGFGAQPVLKDVSLTLRTGEMIVCIGANAGGKTTLIRILSGLLEPASGDVVVRGSVLSSPLGQVGVLFQNPDQQMIAATVEDEIALGLELRGVESHWIEERVEEMLARFRLVEFRNHPPQALSGGQKQRLALAAIMVAKPLFLLLDEPDSFLDAPSRRELLDGIESIRGDCGILWTSPHPRHVPLADRWLLLQHGTLTEHPRGEFPMSLEASLS
jgi:energy-coupling factor transport system ATP-binding protein